ncbi:arylesterase [Celeribacter indicus]|uniref:Acyl-CoA thioesterase n=1 Tax=Celeribacter indicus TaxID=1208324 RepID=A0A0B5DZK8_9RHOB|nr:acyl-CoA thioesterase [Celeribacter indicus]SDW40392.1 acyl-CoA thioesterase-1 [Celeribacter indicus]
MAETITVAALGDSLTQGYGLMREEGFTARLQDWLDAHDVDATVLNAGVSGDTTAGGLSRVDWTLSPEVGAMIVALGGNDVLRGIAPETARENLTGILEAARAKDVPVLLVGIAAPNNYGAAYRESFEAIYPDLSQEFDTLYFPNFLAPLTDLGEMSEVMARYVQADGIHPNAEGVKLIVEAMGPKVAELVERARD